MTVNRPVSTHEWLKHQLKVSGISQSQISRQLNLARNTVSLWLTARQKIPLKHLLSIARLLGTDQLYIRNIALQEMCPDKDLWELDEKIRLLGTLTANEYRFIKLIREVGTNPRMNQQQESRFTEFLKGLEPDDGTWELADLDSNNGRLYTSDEIKKILEEKLEEQPHVSQDNTTRTRLDQVGVPQSTTPTYTARVNKDRHVFKVIACSHPLKQ